MVEIIQENGSSTVFPKEPIDKDLLLSSLRDYNKDGVVLGVEKVLTPKKNKYNKVTINTVLTVIGSMDKGRKYILDEQGQYTFYIDDKTGEKRRDLEVGDCQLCTVFFPFYAVPEGEGLDENTPLLITPGTSSYSFFKEAYINGEALPKDCGNVAFKTNFKEMKEVVEGFNFRGYYAEGGKNNFQYLRCEQLDEEEE